jgi:hypothetical protein
MSDFSGAEYGNDQVNFDTDDIKDLLYTTNANQLHDVNKIQEREARILRKINEFRPTCQENRTRNNNSDCKPSIFSHAGSYIEQNRMDRRKNIEDFYFGGREARMRDCNDTHAIRKEQQNLRKKSQKIRFNVDDIQSGSTYKRRTDKKETFSAGDAQFLQDEIDEMEKKNNLLVVFIFFLVILVIVQYAKINNGAPPIQVMMLPKDGNSGSGIQKTSVLDARPDISVKPEPN